MLPENYKIQPFDMKNIPLMLEVVVPMWSPPTEVMNFRRFYVEGIIRRNYFENDLHYQLVEKSSERAGACTAYAGSHDEFTSMASLPANLISARQTTGI